MTNLFRRIRLAVVTLAFSALVVPSVPHAATARLLESGDAYLDLDAAGPSWTLGNSAIRFSIRVMAGTLSTTIETPIDTGALRAFPTADTPFAVDGRAISLTAAGGFAYASYEAAPYARGVELTLKFVNQADHLTVGRHFVVVPGAPAMVTWSAVETAGGQVHKVSSLNGWSAAVAGGRDIHWLTGLTDPDSGVEPFTLMSRGVRTGGPLQLRSRGRSSDENVPWLAVVGSRASFFGGVMWSGRWRMDVTEAAGRVDIATGIDGTEAILPPGGTVEGPRGFYGVTGGNLAGVSSAMVLLQSGLRDRAPAPPPVVYNTWYAYGASMDEETLRVEADRAARLGVEVFVVDAGWWLGSGEGSDFTTGLGAYTPDPAKFPSGLRAFADYVRARGMKFGLWVEPERVAWSNVGRGLPVQTGWVASSAGDSNLAQTMGQDSAQLCLGVEGVRRLVLSRLTTLIDEVGVDYLKWDNNKWIECTRSTHGHGALEGSYAHVRGLYQILGELRQRYPDLIVENCAQGGHRLDLELGSLTDIAWMDDHTSPASRIRHNQSGLGRAFGAAYLLALAMPDEQGLRFMMRSRMAGALGIGFPLAGLDEAQLALLAQEVARYQSVRDITQDAAVVPLTAPPPAEGEPADAWDAVSLVSVSTREAVLLSFENQRGVESMHLVPQGLDATATYRILSADGDELATASGAELMTGGLDLPGGGTDDPGFLVLRRAAS